MILSDLASVSRLFRRLVIPLAPLIILLVLLVVRDWFLFASRSSMESGYAVAGDEVTAHGTYFAARNKNAILRIIVAIEKVTN